ncbi:MAG: hypothetical protein AAFO69_11210 [Bacteroidota bacterium]
MKQTLYILLLAATLTSCLDEDIVSPTWNDASFEPIQSLQPFEDAIPAYDFDYWELVWHKPQGDEVHFRSGVICKDAEDPMDCAQQFYRIRQLGTEFPKENESGANHYYYLRSNEQGYNKYWYDREDLSAFLGAIDSKGDALLIAAANGYHFEKGQRSASGIKQEGNTYRIIALKTVSICAPFQVNKVLLEVDQNANLNVLDEAVYLHEEKSCSPAQKGE